VKIHIVYAHPEGSCFTREILESFVSGLEASGHEYTMADLYKENFFPLLDGSEYKRESELLQEVPVPDDVQRQQELLDSADIWVFVYPVWWTDCPAILKGWFDRVWTVNYAYHEQRCRTARKALVLCTAGHTAEELTDSGCYQAMKTVMLTDRINTRAEDREFVLFGGSEVENRSLWPKMREDHLRKAYMIGKNLSVGKNPEKIVDSLPLRVAEVES